MEYRIPVGDMVDMEEVEKDEVPGNPYRVQEDVEVENTVLDDAVEADRLGKHTFIRDMKANADGYDLLYRMTQAGV